VQAADTTVLAEYIGRLPVGARVRVALTNGDVMRATLLRNDRDPIVLQRRARIPEAPVEIPLAQITALELETNGGGVGRAVAIGAASAAAATLGIIMLLAAVFAD
jgi:hypothetical protein